MLTSFYLFTNIFLKLQGFFLTSAEYDEILETLRVVRARRTHSQKSHHQHVSFGGMTFAKNKFSKQAVVKMISNLPKDRIKNCIDYTLKNSLDGYAINDKGEKVSSDDIIKEWSKDFGSHPNSKDAWHLIFSIKEPCSDERALKKLQSSVMEVMNKNFFGHKYSMVLHTHQNNPHIHVVLNKRNIFSDKKIHFDSRDEIKDFFDDVRTNFAYALDQRGLNYTNTSSLSKDLKQEWNKIKKSVKLETDDYFAKDFINDYYMKLQERNKENHKATASRIDVLLEETVVLKNEHERLFQLLINLKKKKNKRWYKVSKEYKEQGNFYVKKLNEIKGEVEKLRKIEYRAQKIAEFHKANYQDKVGGVVRLENFVYNYNQMRKAGFKTSKSDFENFKRAKRAIAIHRKKESELAIKYFDDSLIVSRMLGASDSIFKLDKKLKNLDQALHSLHNSSVGDELINLYDKRLKANKEFITDVVTKRFERVSQRLLKAEKISKDDFLFKEYFKGVEVLGVRADERLLKIKNEKRLYKDVLAERGIKIAKPNAHSFSHKNHDLSSERGL